MRIGILGTGHMGTALGRLWAQSGHELFFGSRTPSKGASVGQQIGENAAGGSIPDAVQFGQVVLLAVPWPAMPDILGHAGSLSGKILIDCTNPLGVCDSTELTIGFTTSAAEEIARMAPEASVVKAFNAVIYRILNAGPLFDDQRASIFYCGDHQDANAIVASLIADTGFEPVFSGPLTMARILEPLAVLLIEIGYALERNPQMALKLLHR